MRWVKQIESTGRDIVAEQIPKLEWAGRLRVEVCEDSELFAHIKEDV